MRMPSLYIGGVFGCTLFLVQLSVAQSSMSPCSRATATVVPLGDTHAATMACGAHCKNLPRCSASTCPPARCASAPLLLACC